MKIRATLLSVAKVCVVVTAAGAAGACAGSPNKVLADTPVLPYLAPDIEEITGIEEPEEEEAEEEMAPSPAPAPAPAPAAAAPAPAKQAAKAAPAKPAAKAAPAKAAPAAAKK